MNKSQPNLVVIGGGTGSFTLLQEFKEITPNLTSLVNMSDDGGSTGKLRDEYGVLPPGDVRQCLVALSSLEEVRDMFTYRFGTGDLEGHALGNLILAGLEQKYDGDFMRAVKMAGRMLNVTGRVVPVTTEKHILVMDDGSETIRGEFKIGDREIKNSGAKVRHDPPTKIREEAEAAIDKADVITIAPGNLFGSILPALAVGGMREAIRDSRAEVVMVTNLVNKPGQTDGWHIKDHVETVGQYIDVVDHVLYNTRLPGKALLKKYASEGEFPVRICEGELGNIESNLIGSDMLSDYIYSQNGNDTLMRRTYIRHDAKKVGCEIMRLLSSKVE
jgi:uncharacterized cofD-like protein